MRNCNHIKSDGRPCNAPALRKHSYCFFHQQQLVRRRREYPDRLPILEDRAAVQVAIMQVLDRLYLKTIDYKAAALMLYGLQLASTNLKQDVFGRLNSEKVIATTATPTRPMCVPRTPRPQPLQFLATHNSRLPCDRRHGAPGPTPKALTWGLKYRNQALARMEI